MANTTGKKFGGRKKGTPNKINAPFRDTLNQFARNNLTEEELARLYQALNDTEKAVFLPKVLPYLTAKMQHIEVSGVVTDEQIEAMIDYLADSHESTTEGKV